MAFDELPALQSLSDQVYWGNENPCVSSILLASIAAICGKKQDSTSGSIIFPLFVNSDYKFLNEIPSSYPFAPKRG